MTSLIEFNRFIPFVVHTTQKEDNGVINHDQILNQFRFENWKLESHSKQDWFKMKMISDRIANYARGNIRNFPIVLISDRPTIGTKTVDSDGIDVEINYLATIIFGLIYASRQNQDDDDKLQASIWINQLSNFLDNIIEEEISDEDPSVLENILETAQIMLRALAPKIYPVYEKLLEELEVTTEDGKKYNFHLIKNIDISIEQIIYLYDTKIGFLVNKIKITGLNELDPSIISSIDLLFRLCSSGFTYKAENIEDLIPLISKLTAVGDLVITVEANAYDILSYDEKVDTINLQLDKCLISTPLVDLYESQLRQHLFLVKIHGATELTSQAEFRTSLKNSGSYRQKIPVFKTLQFLFLQIFHEKFQTSVFLEIYREIWNKWHRELSDALSWDTLKIVKGGMSHLAGIYNQANKLELFFASEFADLNLSVKIEELAETMKYHVFFSNLSEDEVSLLTEDFNYIRDTIGFIVSKIEEFNEESSYLEYIDSKSFLVEIGHVIGLQDEYSIFRDMHDSLEKMLSSIQDISQTKQQRWITIGIVIFSAVQLLLGVLEVMK